MWAKAYPATTHSFYRSPILLLFARRRDSLFAGELFLTTGPHHESLIIFFFCFSVILLDQWLSCQFRIKTKKIIRKKKEKQEINSEIGKNYSLFTTHFHFFFVRQILKLETIKKADNEWWRVLILRALRNPWRALVSWMSLFIWRTLSLSCSYFLINYALCAERHS